MGYNGLKKSWIFPGQASQFVGMGKDLFDSTDVGKKYYNLANDILEFDIQDISFNGPEEKLKITKFTQPAIFIVSSVISHLLTENGHVPVAWLDIAWVNIVLLQQLAALALKQG